MKLFGMKLGWELVLQGSDKVIQIHGVTKIYRYRKSSITTMFHSCAVLCCVQGALGRFGGVELSDVAAWLELPDGKVLSGSEAGDLLLWEGGLIKAVISRWGAWCLLLFVGTDSRVVCCC